MNTQRESRKRSSLLDRRGFLKLSGAALLCGSLAGCGGEKRTSGPVRLLFSHGPDESGVLQTQIHNFNEQHRGKIKVVFQQAPTDTGEYFSQLRTEFQANEMKVDVISGDVIWTTQLAARGWISALSDRFVQGKRNRYLQNAITSNIYEGKIWGVPWFTDAGMLFYREDLLTKSGFKTPPRTWDELKAMAKKVMKDQNIQNGHVFEGAQYEGGVVNGLEYIWSAGGRVFGPDNLNKVAIGESPSVHGLEVERSMVTSGVTPDAVSSYKELEAYTIFLGGGAVFMRNWPYVYGLAADPSQSKITQKQIGVASLPVARSSLQSHGCLGGWNLMINSGCKNPDAAWTFIEYLAAPEQQKRRAIQASYLPTLKSLYTDEEIMTKVPVIRLGKQAIKNARPRPATPHYNNMSLAMAARFHASLAGTISPEHAASALQKQIKALIK